MLPSFARKAVTILRAPYIDSRGTKVRDWKSNDVQQIPVTGCHFQPVSSSTSWTDSSQAVTIDATLWLPFGTDIRADDHVIVNNTEYAVQGAPMLWESPTGAIDHIECGLVRWVL